MEALINKLVQMDNKYISTDIEELLNNDMESVVEYMANRTELVKSIKLEIENSHITNSDNELFTNLINTTTAKAVEKNKEIKRVIAKKSLALNNKKTAYSNETLGKSKFTEEIV